MSALERTQGLCLEVLSNLPFTQLRLHKLNELLPSEAHVADAWGVDDDVNASAVGFLRAGREEDILRLLSVSFDSVCKRIREGQRGERGRLG